MSPRIHIKDCTRDYIKALHDPRSLLGTERYPCVPDLVCFPTAKFAVRAKFTVLPDTSGNFSIAVQPDKPYGGTNGALPWAGSGGLWDPGNPPASFTPAGYGDFISPFNAAAFPSGGTGGSQTRVVGAALYVRSTTNPLNRKGVLRAWRAPTSYNSTLSANQISVMGDTQTFLNDGREVCATYTPRSNDDLAFQRDVGTMETSHFGIWGEGLSNTDSFMVEYVAFYEAISNLMPTGVTASHSDPNGFAAAIQTNTKAGTLDSAKTAIAAIVRASKFIADASGIISHPIARMAVAAGTEYLTRSDARRALPATSQPLQIGWHDEL